MADLLLFITSWIALIIFFFFFNDTATTEIYTLSLHDALPISFQGEQDLDKKLIRSVGDPNWRFQEDYLRILRALRFSARFQFRIHARTLEAAKANAQGLAQLSAERVRDEWFKGIMTAARVCKLLTLGMEVGAARS